MSDLSQMDVVVAPEGNEKTSYVDWPAIIAGIVLASAISLVLLTFGSALGLSFIDFRAGPDVLPIWVAIAAASWLLWVEVSSFMAGAYLTGRLRKRHHDASEHESDVRDGAHGLLVWAGALVVGAIIATGGISAVAGAVGSAASTLTTAASNVADDAAAMDPNATSSIRCSGRRPMRRRRRLRLPIRRRSGPRPGGSSPKAPSPGRFRRRTRPISVSSCRRPPACHLTRRRPGSVR